MGVFEKIDFVDDNLKTTAFGDEVIGTVKDLEELSVKYSHVFVAIANPEVRLQLINKLRAETLL